MWEFVHGKKSIKAPNQIIPLEIMREDRKTTKELIYLGCNKTDLVWLNRVGSHFKVIYISKITEGSGGKDKCFNI